MGTSHLWAWHGAGAQEQVPSLSVLPNLGKDAGFLCKDWKPTQLLLFRLQQKAGSGKSLACLQKHLNTPYYV